MPRNERNIGTIINALADPSEQADVQKDISKEGGKDIQTIIREKQQALKDKKAAKVKQEKDKLEKQKKQSSSKKDQKKKPKVSKKSSKSASKKSSVKSVSKSGKVAGKSAMFASSKGSPIKGSAAKSQSSSKQSSPVKKSGKPSRSFFGAKGTLGSSGGEQAKSTLQNQAGNAAAVIQSGQTGH
jgi:hypothetical protein